MTPAQSRAARGLLDWSQTELASRSDLSEGTVRNFETGRHIPSPNNHAAMQRAFESAGVEFTNGGQPGVRMKAVPHDPSSDVPQRDPEEADRNPPGE